MPQNKIIESLLETCQREANLLKSKQGFSLSDYLSDVELQHKYHLIRSEEIYRHLQESLPIFEDFAKNVVKFLGEG